jgi:DNA end-binding protein Ku
VSAPRSIWNGTITFGLVTVPVKVYSATESKTVHFHEVHVADGARVEHRRICPQDGETVDYDDIVKGFEVRKGTWVELGDEEIAAAVGSRSKLVDIDHFVPAEAIDPEYHERTYHLGAGDDGEEPYALLHAALDRAGRAGIGRWVFHDRERTVIVRPLGDVLAMHTMRYAEQLVDPTDLELGRVQRKPTKREIEMARALIEGLHKPFRPSRYQDTYRTAVLKLIERKAAGEEIEPPAAEPEESSADLVAALEASMRKGRRKGSRKPAAKRRAKARS